VGKGSLPSNLGRKSVDFQSFDANWPENLLNRENGVHSHKFQRNVGRPS